MSKVHKTAEGFLTNRYYTQKTYFRGGYGGKPTEMVRTLTRSFDTLEDANKFSEGKAVRDIFTKNGRFVVEWVKVTKVD